MRVRALWSERLFNPSSTTFSSAPLTVCFTSGNLAASMLRIESVPKGSRISSSTMNETSLPRPFLTSASLTGAPVMSKSTWQMRPSAVFVLISPQSASLKAQFMNAASSSGSPSASGYKPSENLSPIGGCFVVQGAGRVASNAERYSLSRNSSLSVTSRSP